MTTKPFAIPMNEPEISKAVKMPVSLWERIKPLIHEQDSNFSQFCRRALRQLADGMTNHSTVSQPKKKKKA